VKLLRHRAPPDAHRGAFAAIPVVLVGPTAVPGDAVEALGKSELQPEARQLGKRRRAGAEAMFHHHVGAAVDRVAGDAPRVAGGELHRRFDHRRAGLSPDGDRLHGPLGARLAPRRAAHRHAVAVVVVGGRPPEIGDGARPEHRDPLIGP